MPTWVYIGPNVPDIPLTLAALSITSEPLGMGLMRWTYVFDQPIPPEMPSSYQPLLLNLPQPKQLEPLLSMVKALLQVITTLVIQSIQSINLSDEAVYLYPLTATGPVYASPQQVDYIASICRPPANLYAITDSPLILYGQQQLLRSGLAGLINLEWTRLPGFSKGVYGLKNPDVDFREPEGPDSLGFLLKQGLDDLQARGVCFLQKALIDPEGDTLLQEIATAFNYRDLGPLPIGHVWSNSSNLTGWTPEFFLRDAILQIRKNSLPRVLIGGPWQNQAMTSIAKVQTLAQAYQAYWQLNNPVLLRYGHITVEPDLSLMVSVTQAQDITTLIALLTTVPVSQNIQAYSSLWDSLVAQFTVGGVVVPTEKGFELVSPKHIPTINSSDSDRFIRSFMPRDESKASPQTYLYAGIPDEMKPWVDRGLLHPGQSFEPLDIKPIGTELVLTPIDEDMVLEILWKSTGQRQELMTIPISQAKAKQDAWLKGSLLSRWSRAQVQNGRDVSIFPISM